MSPKLIAKSARVVVLWMHLLGMLSSVFPGVRLERSVSVTGLSSAFNGLRKGAYPEPGRFDSIKELALWNWERLLALTHFHSYKPGVSMGVYQRNLQLLFLGLLFVIVMGLRGLHRTHESRSQFKASFHECSSACLHSGLVYPDLLSDHGVPQALVYWCGCFDALLLEAAYPSAMLY